MLRRTASRAGSAIMVAPVSTRKRTGFPFTKPSPAKWPPGPAGSTACARSAAGAALRKCWPCCRTRLRPSSSIVARAFSTESTVMPFQLWPTFTVFGSTPSTARTAALSPITPTSATSAAAAKPQARKRTSAIIAGMKPVAIFRTARSEGPGYFASYLERRGIAWQLVALDEGGPVPRDPRHFSGLVFMGGAMSVNDDLPWIAQVLELIREAVRTDLPVLGQDRKSVV